MNPTDHIVKPPFTPKRGLFATLSGLLHTQGPTASASSRRTLTVAFALAATLAALTVAATPALAARGHEFKESIGTPCTPAAEPCAPGTLKEPVGVGLNEESGNLYVPDRALGRVTVLDSAGAFVSQITGPSATGKGAVASGSATVTGVATETGAFIAGEEVTGPGVPAATTVKQVVSATELELSQAATATEPGAALSAHEDFLPLQGIAVDNACARQVPPLTGGECEAFDPSGGDIYVASGEEGRQLIDKFTASGVFITEITGFTSGDRFKIGQPAGIGVAVDPTGRLWVAGGTGSEDGVGVFDNALVNQPTGQFFPTERPTAGFALNSAGGFYLPYGVFGNKFVAEYGPAGEQLTEREFAKSEAPTALATDPVSGDLYVDTGAKVSRFAPGGLEASPTEVFGQAQLTDNGGAGLTLDTKSNLYLADSAAGVVDLFALQQPAKPTVEGVSVSEVTGDSATLSAEVNPRGDPTAYRFEYGPCVTPSTCASSPYGHIAPVPDGGLPGDFEAHSVSIHPQGLEPGTAYLFRLVATSPLGTGEAEKTFTTQGAGGSLLLPDGRQWELVSPQAKAGLIEPIGEKWVTEAAAAGDSVTYTSNAPTEAEPQGNSNKVQVLSARGPSGWSSRDIASPHEAATGIAGALNEYPFFSSDLSAAVLQPLGSFTASLSPQASEQTAYLRSDFTPGDPSAFCTSACYRPLVTGRAGFADVPPGTVFGEAGDGNECPPESACGPQFAGATPDLSHIVLSYEHAGLTATPGDQGGLYEWSAGAAPAEALRLLSVLPGGGPASVASAPRLGEQGRVARGAISADGSRVFFSEFVGNKHLYVRENALQPQSAVSGSATDGSQCAEPAKACTIQLDEVQPGASGKGEAGPEFQLATADGSKAFFIDSQALTADAGEGTADAGDLYEYDLSKPAGQRLTDLTPKTPGGESALVTPQVIGASPDGSYLYFAAAGALAPGAQPGNCDGLAGTTCNLYLRHTGATSLIAVLSSKADFPAWGHDVEALGRLAARVSPDGRWLSFASAVPLTGYDNRDAATGRPAEEVYLYHAPAAGSSGGGLVCASCNPTGARPHAVPYEDLLVGMDGPLTLWPSGQLIAASLPGWTQIDGNGMSRYQPRYLSDGGRLFFNAVDSLVPSDTNNTGDVYSYEPPRGGESEPPGDGCTTSSPTYSPRSEGCVDLISSGTSAAESGFLDASESGSDVFFFTNSRLTPGDTDSARDVYDAHLCTAASPCPPPPPPSPPACNGDACQSTVSPPNDPTPGSLTFQGPGNLTPPTPVPVKPPTAAQIRAQKLARALKACHAKHNRHKRQTCERQAHKHYPSKPSKGRR